MECNIRLHFSATPDRKCNKHCRQKKINHTASLESKTSAVLHFQLETQDDLIFSFFRSRDCGCNLKEQQINVPIKLALVPLGFHESLDATRDKRGQ